MYLLSLGSQNTQKWKKMVLILTPHLEPHLVGSERGTFIQKCVRKATFLSKYTLPNLYIIFLLAIILTSK